MARKVAHEVKNPLTPIAISVSDLKRSYEQQRPDFQGDAQSGGQNDQRKKWSGSKHMLQEFSEFGRLPAPQFQNCRLGDLFTDLNTLYTKDVSGKATGPVEPRPKGHLSRRSIATPPSHGQLAPERTRSSNGNGRGHHDRQPQPQTKSRSRYRIMAPGLSARGQTRKSLLPRIHHETNRQRGFGLVMVERIVSDHGGTITVQSAPRSGHYLHFAPPARHRILTCHLS